MNNLDYVVNKVLDVIRRDIRKSASDSSDIGTVKRIDGNIAWVQYDENNPQLTPVVISGASCKEGDIVRIKNNNGTAFILGNDSNPPTDDTKAEHAQVIAEEADKTAKDAQITASEALEDAEHTAQYFWYKDGTGSEAGAHVTQVPQEDFEADPQGGNLIMRTEGIAVRDGTTELATFGADTITLGDDDDPFTITYPSTYTCQIKREDGNSKAYIDFYTWENSEGTDWRENVTIWARDNDKRSYLAINRRGASFGADNYALLDLEKDDSNNITAKFWGTIISSNHDSEIGYTTENMATGTLANTTALTKLSDLVTLSAGTWVVTASIRFQSSTTGSRAAELYNGSNAISSSYVASPANGVVALNLNAVIKSDSSIDLDIHARQNSGASMTVNTYWQAVRIA